MVGKMVGKARNSFAPFTLKFKPEKHLTVNQRVVGSSPTGGAETKKPVNSMFIGFFVF
jgi:hypothetical protein